MRGKDHVLLLTYVEQFCYIFLLTSLGPPCPGSSDFVTSKANYLFRKYMPPQQNRWQVP